MHRTEILISEELVNIPSKVVNEDEVADTPGDKLLHCHNMPRYEHVSCKHSKNVDKTSIFVTFSKE